MTKTPTSGLCGDSRVDRNKAKFPASFRSEFRNNCFSVPGMKKSTLALGVSTAMLIPAAALAQKCRR
jgi:hypothetical protein